jgi:hypothetical protein
MKKEFSYFKKGNQYFPLIEIKLKKKNKELKTKALVDSGASFSLFRGEIAEYLKIPLKKGKPIYLTGLRGKILGYLHKIPIEAVGKNFICKIVFSKELNVSFNILGRDNFFLPFLITFFEKKKKIILE